MKRFIAWIIIMALFIPAYAEEPLMFSMTEGLRGRIRPGKRSTVVTTFAMWAPLHPTGRISSDGDWVEVITSEDQTVWCSIDYVTERRDVIHVYTLWDEGVKIRSKPGNGRVTGTARKEQVLEITQVIGNFGRCSKGWIDLDYFIEDCD